MKPSKELAQILDILWDEPGHAPDMNLVSHVVAGSAQPIRLLQDVVYVLWLALETPQEFDKVVGELE